jgi:hypothetical protein
VRQVLHPATAKGAVYPSTTTVQPLPLRDANDTSDGR